MNRPSEIFGSDVFDIKAMQRRLPKSTFKALKHSIEEGDKLPANEADTIAHAIMEWATEKGATHYTHWFQPMTGLTAQKHDAFFSLDKAMNPIEAFSGSQLIQGEPDASSFPSGGMRTTFEARGYTAWDPSSPVFIMTNGSVPVLCIPSVFFSYTGHALDKKTPLLRSTRTLSQSAARAIELLEGKKVKVGSTVGCEQEYFLVDRKYFDKRPDLIMAGRTLLGCPPAKGQQMEDHYFGSIKDRVLAFMADVESRLYRLGVPCKTRHNEVAPHQFETAPIFESANMAADHNQLVMEVLKKSSKDHGMAALLHEKPFADVNGSGKHLNWSMSTSEDVNLLEPGKEPHTNVVFLYFLVAVINGVHKHGGALRSTIASAGNDHRLGANEAPPAIMSTFLGSHLNNVLDQLERAESFTDDTISEIDLGLAQLPDIHVDTTDRNRTSPFAFTGNKFEFRALGSNQSISIPATMLNAAVADSLNEMNADLAKLENVDEKSIFEMLRPYITRSKPVRFEGNNYSEEWHEEAAKRGLPNLKNTPEAYTVWDNAEARKFITDAGILSDDELDARTSIRLEHYAKQVGIEATLTMRMVDNHVLPPSFRYQTEVSTALRALAESGLDDSVLATAKAEQGGHLERLTSAINSLLGTRKKLESAIKKVHEIEGEKEEAMTCATDLIPAMEAVRAHCDALEQLVDAQQWELPGYHELLFLM
ncbi:MAG: glutamine synthetase III [Acidobacteriota bacterium]|nr:glutamine synthetase III [Acidobacteriota bacterium]